MPPKRTDTTQRAHPNDYKKSAKEKRAATRYDELAKQKAGDLYLLYNGKNLDRVVLALRREYPWITKGTIQTWALQRNWDFLVAEKIKRDTTIALTDSEELYNEVKLIRTKLYEEIKKAKITETEAVRDHLAYAKESRELLLKIKSDSDSLGGFLAMFESLVKWLPDYSREATDALQQIKDEIIDRAILEFGEKETEDDDRPV